MTMANKEWQKPEIKEVALEADEDVLAQCWSPSAATPLEGHCGGMNHEQNSSTCPDF